VGKAVWNVLVVRVEWYAHQTHTRTHTQTQRPATAAAVRKWTPVDVHFVLSQIYWRGGQDGHFVA
jgi:hypothetical protein